MAKEQPKLDDLMKTPQAAQLLKNKAAVMDLMHSEDAQKLLELLNRSGGQTLKSAADSALQGDVHQLAGLIEDVMHSREGAGLIQRINDAIPGK